MTSAALAAVPMPASIEDVAEQYLATLQKGRKSLSDLVSEAALTLGAIDADAAAAALWRLVDERRVSIDRDWIVSLRH
ncbi:MAG: hypothetical protein U0X73_11100 [Thermoanaerobaculia bacterium]